MSIPLRVDFDISIIGLLFINKNYFQYLRQSRDINPANLSDINRHNSGFVEGLNNKIKVLKRRCYGLLNLDRLFQRLFLDLEGYRLFV